ncbi:hypothetical protein BS78_K036300 [Paspalum vaginatum]|uniref:Uncharacterized protein n=1 Tax=Paspalum vaginatum TaxID=158149 RepID=A0A9W8CCV1_9POAL|nr:hypothetical protein BS78_K036300 [Paspalum vaginatum]
MAMTVGLVVFLTSVAMHGNITWLLNETRYRGSGFFPFPKLVRICCILMSPAATGVTPCRGTPRIGSPPPTAPAAIYAGDFCDLCQRLPLLLLWQLQAARGFCGSRWRAAAAAAIYVGDCCCSCFLLRQLQAARGFCGSRRRAAAAALGRHVAAAAAACSFRPPGTAAAPGRRLFPKLPLQSDLEEEKRQEKEDKAKMEEPCILLKKIWL